MHVTASTRYAGKVAIIDLHGRVCLAGGIDVMRQAVRQEIQSGYKLILLNLAGVSYIDSAGLGEMASVYITLSNMGGSVKLAQAQQKVQGMLRLTRLSALLATYPTESEALAAFE